MQKEGLAGRDSQVTDGKQNNPAEERQTRVFWNHVLRVSFEEEKAEKSG